jgi:hypothetical protein
MRRNDEPRPTDHPNAQCQICGKTLEEFLEVPFPSVKTCCSTQRNTTKKSADVDLPPTDSRRSSRHLPERSGLRLKTD